MGYPTVARIIGPSLAEVSAFLASYRDLKPIAWDSAPEVHVKCPTSAVLEGLLGRFGDSVYSLDGSPLEAVVGAALVAAGFTVATAESCTGGLIGHLLTNVPGSSNYFLGGVVAYSNAAKAAMLGVPEDVLAAYGAVSREVVEAMAQGALRVFSASFGLAVSGIAGPSGGTSDKPVGTVWMAVAGEHGVQSRRLSLAGDRLHIKQATACHALDMLRRAVLGLG